MENARRIFGNRVEYATGSSDCLEQADCCILITEWPEFKKIRPEVYIKKMRQPFVIDGRRFLDLAIFRSAGVHVRAIGLGPES
jgi:UDPglucose 6-dehydrogenase